MHRPTIALALLVLTFTPVPAQSQQPPQGSRDFPYLLAAGDLDGDGAPDVVTSGTPSGMEVPGVGWLPGDPVVAARRGLDGELLWERDAWNLELLPVPLGEDGDPGVVLVRGNWLRSESGGSLFGHKIEVREVELLAIAGDGTDLWQVTTEKGLFVGAAYLDENKEPHQATVLERHPVFAGLLAATPGPAEDALLAIVTRRETPDDIQSTVEIVLVDGADGEPAWTVTVQTEDTRPVVHPAGDLDGDGLEDFVVLREPTVDGLTARRGTDGSVLWSNPGDVLLPSASVQDLGDVTGDGVDDLAALGTGGAFTTLPPTIRVLDGATGAVLLSETASTIAPVGPLDDEGTAGLLTQRVVQSPDREVRYRLLDPAGNLLVERVVPEPAEESTFVALIPDAGDLDGDGVAEAGHRVMRATRIGGTPERISLVDGRTLSPVFEGPAGLPLGASLDAAGDDVVLVNRTSPATLTVTARDGATGDPLWTSVLSVDGDYPQPGPVVVQPLDVDGDGVPEVVLDARSSRADGDDTTPSIRSGSWVLSGVDGRVLWSA